MRYPCLVLVLAGGLLSLPTRALQADLAPETLRKGLTLIKLGQLKEAISLFEQETTKRPDEAQAYFYLGLAHEKAGHTEEALAGYRRAIELKPNEADFHYTLGRFYLSLGDEEAALKEFELAQTSAPQSPAGVLAEKEKRKLQMTLKDRALVEDWLKKEAEAKKAKEATGGETELSPEGGKEGAAGEAAGQIGEEAKREPAEKLIKTLRHGRERQRRQASETLLAYPAEETQPFVQILIALLRRERVVDIRKNIITLVGQTKTEQGTEALLRIFKNPQEDFQYKLVALASLGSLQEKKVILALRTTLSEMVASRVREREEARKNLDSLQKQLEELETEKLTLEAEISTLETRRNELQNKISGGFLEPGAPPGVPGMPGQPAPTLKPADIVKIQKEIKTLEQQIEGKRKQIELIQQKRQEAEEKKMRYLSLLARKQTQTGQETASAVPAVMPPEMAGPVEETEEGKNEQQFALALIDTLGRLKDEESLPVIRNAWQEYGSQQHQLLYDLALARLGDFSRMSSLLERLREDLPEGEAEAEVKLRCSIIEVLGEYLKVKPDEELKELLQYLAEESSQPQLSEAARQVLGLKKSEPKEKKKAATTAQKGPGKTGPPEIPPPEFARPPAPITR